jgi:hypothetical protein
MTTNGKGELTLLTPKYKEINSVLERIHKSRISKRQLKQNRTFIIDKEEVVIGFIPHFS